MRKFLSVMILLLVVSFAFSEICSAQLINYDRRKNVQSGNTNTGYRASAPQPTAAVPAQIEEPKPVESTMTAPPEAAPAEEMAMNTLNGFKVTNRIEEIYDTDNDGSLQMEEVNSFLKDVVSAVERKGSFSVSSDILKQFDKNDDGMISKVEARMITSQVR